MVPPPKKKHERQPYGNKRRPSNKTNLYIYKYIYSIYIHIYIYTQKIEYIEIEMYVYETYIYIYIYIYTVGMGGGGGVRTCDVCVYVASDVTWVTCWAPCFCLFYIFYKICYLYLCFSVAVVRRAARVVLVPRCSGGETIGGGAAALADCRTPPPATATATDCSTEYIYVHI